MSRLDYLEEKWEAVDERMAEHFETKFGEFVPEFLELILLSIVEYGSVEVGTFNETKRRGSIVSHNMYDTDKQLNIKCTGVGQFELEIKFDDFDQKEYQYSHKFSKDEVSQLPQGLVNVMTKAFKERRFLSMDAKSLN